MEIERKIKLYWNTNKIIYKNECVECVNFNFAFLLNDNLPTQALLNECVAVCCACAVVFETLSKDGVTSVRVAWSIDNFQREVHRSTLLNSANMYENNPRNIRCCVVVFNNVIKKNYAIINLKTISLFNHRKKNVHGQRTMFHEQRKTFYDYFYHRKRTFKRIRFISIQDTTRPTKKDRLPVC